MAAVASSAPIACGKRWLTEAGIDSGPVFRRIDQWGNLDRQALTSQSVNLILKARCKQAGLDAEKFSAHGLCQPWHSAPRMQQSVAQAARYYNNAERKNGRGAADRLSTTTRRVRRRAYRLTCRMVPPLPHLSRLERHDRRQALPCPSLRQAASATPSRPSSDAIVAGRRRGPRCGADHRRRRSPRWPPVGPFPTALQDFQLNLRRKVPSHHRDQVAVAGADVHGPPWHCSSEAVIDKIAMCPTPAAIVCLRNEKPGAGGVRRASIVTDSLGGDEPHRYTEDNTALQQIQAARLHR